MAVVRGYQLLVSPSLGANCRYAPSCSGYALGALQRHGTVAGLCLAAGRVLRCHPLATGGDDPVPAELSGWLTRLQGRSPIPSPSPANADTASSLSNTSS